jgi:hypothetical protein
MFTCIAVPSSPGPNRLKIAQKADVTVSICYTKLVKRPMSGMGDGRHPLPDSTTIRIVNTITITITITI